MAVLKVFLLIGFAVSLAQNQYNSGQNVERPCEVFELDCIRQFLAKYAKCKPVHGIVPEPYYRAQTRALLPSINSTLTLDDVVYKGLNGRVHEFFINRESDKLVLAVEFRNLYTASDRTHFTVYRRAREPITTVDFLKVLYKSMTITIVIPDLKSLKLNQGETFSYVDDGEPRITIGPNAFNSPDLTVRRAAAEFYPNLPIGVREAFLTAGSFIIVTFIQNTLCDFGLNVLQEYLKKFSMHKILHWIFKTQSRIRRRYLKK